MFDDPDRTVPETTSEESRETIFQLDVGRCLQTAVTSYRAHFFPWLVASSLVFALSVVSLGILYGPLTAGALMMAREASLRDSGEPDLARFFNGFRFFGPLLLATALMIVFVAFGFYLLIVPGVLFINIWIYTYILIVDKRLHPFGAMRASQELVRGGGFVAHLGLALIVTASIIGYATLAIGVFLAPIAWLATVEAYRQMTDPRVRAEVDRERSARDSATCGACGYPVRMLSTFFCPECGCDLREVGMIPATPYRKGSTK